jgi:hypothetical protein
MMARDFENLLGLDFAHDPAEPVFCFIIENQVGAVQEIFPKMYFKNCRVFCVRNLRKDTSL